MYHKMGLDPRVKLLLFVAWFSSVFLCRSIYALILLIASSMLILSLTGSLRYVLFRLRNFAPVILLALPLWTFLNKWSLFHASTGIDLSLGLFMTIRLLLIIMISMAFLISVKPTEIVRALNSVRVPPVVTAVLALALRTLYIISEDYKSIKEAHTSRGLELDKGSLIKRIRSHIPLLLPLLIRSMDNAEKMVLALELRPTLLTSRRSSPLRARDLLITLGCLSLIALLLYCDSVLVSSV